MSMLAQTWQKNRLSLDCDIQSVRSWYCACYEANDQHFGTGGKEGFVRGNSGAVIASPKYVTKADTQQNSHSYHHHRHPI